MKPVATLDVAIQQTRWIERGETCGYNGQWTAKRRTRLATLLAGYADGLPRAAGAVEGRDGAEVDVAGRRCPLVGRVSMDLSSPTSPTCRRARRGRAKPRRLFGGAIGVDEFAARLRDDRLHDADRLSRRYARRVIGG